jgi:hypothetical protein
MLIRLTDLSLAELHALARTNGLTSSFDRHTLQKRLLDYYNGKTADGTQTDANLHTDQTQS